MTLLWWISIAALAYVYIGYAAAIWLLVRFRGVAPVRREDVTPRLSIVISAHNEAAVIREKLENTLQLDYPRELLEIAVVSDASTDATDAIVRAYADRGVTLYAQPERRGKTAGLNRTIPQLTGEIVVFSDANAMYRSDALRMLVRNFADPDVGCVTGEARYMTGAPTAADVGERMYWNYEIQLKRLETAVGSVVGGDGAIYAIRRNLWRELPETAINDFLNPLQIVAGGWRAVYEPDAVCFEETAGGMAREFRRRVRIISRSWRAIFQARSVLNPFRVGFFMVSVLSHKILRWFSAVFLGIAAIGLISAVPPSVVTPNRLGVLAAAAVLLLAVPRVRRLASLAIYFFAMTIASLVGVAKGTIGRVSGTWATPREATGRSASHVGAAARRLRVPLWATAVCSVMAAGVIAMVLLAASKHVAASLFWIAAALLVYIYVGYPLILVLLRRVAARPVRKGGVEPSVCLFITANDEATVIGSKLRNSLALEYAPGRLEIVVASDGSVDVTNEIVRLFRSSGVKLLEFPERRGKMAAINAGVPTVRADVIVFSDANTLLDRRAIRALVRSLADPTVGVVSGDVILLGERAALAASEDLYYRYERWLQQAESELGSMIGVDGALYAIRRRLFVPPPDDTILDDLAIPMAALRAGYRAVFEPEARAYEQGSRSAWEEFSRKARIVAGAVQFLRRRHSFAAMPGGQVWFALISHKILRWLSPVFALMVFAASAAIAGSVRFYSLALFVQVALLASGAVGCIPLLRRLKPIGMAHYLCLVYAAVAVGLVRGALGRQAAAWRRFPRGPVDSRVTVGS